MRLQNITNNISAFNSKIGIPVDLRLIKELEAEHALLDQLLTNMESAVAQSNFVQLSNYLNDFASLLRTHFAKENTKFYMRLQYVFPANSAQFEVIREFKDEMLLIGKTINKFLSRYATRKMDEQQKPQFLSDFKAINELLHSRIHNEETKLFPLYKDPTNGSLYEQLLIKEFKPS